LHRVGALGAVMRLRRFAPAPTLGIVTFHHVEDGAAGYPYDPGVADATRAQFRRWIELLARHGTPIRVDDLVRAVHGGPLPKNPVMVTFDDGYRSCHDVALPILRELGVPATFFVSTSFVSERRLFWWERISVLLSGARRRGTLAYPVSLEVDAADPGIRDRLTALVKDTEAMDVERFLDELQRALDADWSRELERRHADELIMTWDHVRALARAGMDVESHTRSHRVLQTVPEAQLADELAGSRRELEAQLARPVRVLAYPVGRPIAREPHIRRAIAAAGYAVGLSNKSGVNRIWPSALRGVMPPLDPYDVRRLAVDRSMSDAMFLTQVAMPRLAYVAPPAP
jgi:peptidoglycan/xylan/chitin deacetylase (PgdA/CDA1 family)